MGPLPQAQLGFSMQDGANVLSAALAGWKPKLQGAPEYAGIPDSNAAAQAAAAKYGPAAIAPGFSGTTTPLGAAPNALLMTVDPLTGLPSLNSSWENFRA
jgi:ABC-type uncharacterized transport system permease subunit